MKRVYSQEQKEEAVRMVLAGRKHREVSEQLHIPHSTIAGWMVEYRETGYSTKNGYKPPKPVVAKPTSTLIQEISIIKEDMLTIAATLDEHIQSLHRWETIEAALIEAGNLKIRLDTAIREKKAYEAKLVERAMVVHSTD